jgi:hypothetical protein
MKGDKMVKTISLKWLQSKGACKESLAAWHKETDHNTFATLNRLVVKNPEWGHWLICRIMNKKQSVQYAIFAAEQVIDIYERKYPDDKRPRNAIEAAKAYLKNPSKKTKAYAAYAADAADAAAYAAAAAAAYAAYAAADAAYAAYAAYAADAADAATYATYADAAADAADDADDATYKRRKMKAKILKYGIGLLEQS